MSQHQPDDDMVFHAGRRRTIVFARTPAGGMPVRDFLDSPIVSDRHLERFARLCEVLADEGAIRNSEVYRKLTDWPLWGFRIGSLRILTHEAGRLVWLLRGAVKQGWKLRDSDLAAAEALARHNATLYRGP